MEIDKAIGESDDKRLKTKYNNAIFRHQTSSFSLLAPDEEFEEYLRHLISEHCTCDRNEMAQLPEGITELLHHEKLSVSLVDESNNNKPEQEAQSPTCVLLPSEELYKLLGEASEEGLDEEIIVESLSLGFNNVKFDSSVHFVRSRRLKKSLLN
ncbi:hypothetical protein DY000_02033711 [Brassica cretica]|uniref:Uncharacterized protein n=1 Tax=Brassica cretica TaxID=69181 RepID=A0ABQ7DS33_BRACR|nr:hypothetical protein DY000_02033711 [Brassica cretica]